MPIYEYQCTDCHHRFDLLQKINDPRVTKCPKCSKETVNRLVSAAGFQLKGTGWYATDFKDKGKSEQKSDHSKAVTSKSDSSAESSAPSETKTTETKTTEPSTTSSGTNKGESD